MGGVIILGVDENRASGTPVLPIAGMPPRRGVPEQITSICQTANIRTGNQNRPSDLDEEAHIDWIKYLLDRRLRTKNSASGILRMP
jgi:hypothetical protein